MSVPSIALCPWNTRRPILTLQSVNLHINVEIHLYVKLRIFFQEISLKKHKFMQIHFAFFALLYKKISNFDEKSQIRHVTKFARNFRVDKF